MNLIEHQVVPPSGSTGAVVVGKADGKASDGQKPKKPMVPVTGSGRPSKAMEERSRTYAGNDADECRDKKRLQHVRQSPLHGLHSDGFRRRESYTEAVVATLVPSLDHLVTPRIGGRILSTGRAVPELREELRRIPSVRNAVSVVSCFAQAATVMGAAALSHRVWVWVIAFILMGRAHAQLAALMHEAAHRTLFRNRRANDIVGRWLLGYVGFTNTDGYRRVHMAHHREEFGPEEPDLALYAAYPISKASMRRKIVRDATGQTGWRLLKQQLSALSNGDARAKRTVCKIYGVQLLLAIIAALAGYPLAYWLLWFAPYMTVWRVINRLRAIAEHGGMQRSKDRRQTTHSVRQHWLSRTFVVPYWIGWHLAHHCDSGIPMRNLPRYHRELIASGFVSEQLEYRSYRQLWRALGSKE